MQRNFKKYVAYFLTALAFLFPFSDKAVEEKASDSHEIEIADILHNVKKDDIKEWINGPARYISRSEEEKEFKELKSDIERTEFIYKFWQKRDPTPWTLKNEFREQFWEKVKTANALFADSTKPGWKTDRGKIYILLGPPNDIEPIAKVDYSYRTGKATPQGDRDQKKPHEGRWTDGHGRAINPFRDTAESGHRGLERWIYRNRKEFKSDPDLIVSFYRDPSGEYILSDNPEHYSKATPYLKIPDYSLPNPLHGEIIKKNKQIEESIALNQLIQMKSDVAQAIDIASGEEILKEVIKALDYYEPLKSEPEFNFFPSEENSDYVLLSVDLHLRDFYDGTISEDNIISLAMFGKVISLSDRSECLFSSDQYAPRHIVREGEKASIMASFLAPPGEYRILGGIQEMLSGRIVSFQKEIDIPDLESCELGIENYVLAKKIESENVEHSILPFGMNVLPKVDNEFHKNEDFGIYYQICGLGIDEVIGEKNFDVTYQFYKRDKDELLKLGKPIIFTGRFEAEQGWSFPLEKWLSGDYILEIEIYDKVSNSTATSSVDFKVLD
ncbi:MAG: GWxTD domain-containing protein [Acidobacteriota bacterium]